MSLFSSIFGGVRTIDASTWPNLNNWSAGRHDSIIHIAKQSCYIWGVSCGDLEVPSSRLVACDPFAFMEAKNNPHINVPQGRFPVSVTLIDLSEKQDRSHIREAYASLIFKKGIESYRKALPLARKGESRPEAKGDEFKGFAVDAGTACFVDESSIERCMPDSSTWYEELFENSRPDCWFNRMDDPTHIRAGIANIVLPKATKGENLILVHSGYGDGCYPVVGSFDKAGNLLSVHIDFFVVPPLLEEER